MTELDIAKWNLMPGWPCPQLLRFYDELAASLTSGIFVEVGVAYGKSLTYLASKAAPGLQILGVDSWLCFMGRNSIDPAKFQYMVQHAGSPRAACEEFLREFGVRERVELCQGNSADVAYALDFEVDGVFLDGSHEYEAVRKDIAAWWPRIKAGGVMAGHDINPHYPGVEQAVDSFFELGPMSQRPLRSVEKRYPTPDSDGWGGVWIVRK